MPTGSAGSGSAASDEFKVPPLAAGYQRFEPPPIDVKPGESEDWAQWVGGPLDQDYDVIDITGVQTKGGHHALVYAGVEAQATGFTRLWKDEDQITTRLMGGLGGEGGAKVNLPAGIVFRVKKGSYIILQTHYLNSFDKPIVGRTVMDVKLSPVDLTRRVASMMSSTSLAINLPARVTSVMDIYCTTQKDLRFLQISNHMHDYGTSGLTEFVDPQGMAHMLKQDVTWSGDLALNPNFTKFPEAMPGFVPKGSTLHTRCTWNNTTDNMIKFPAEMCVFFGFVLNDADITCTDNKWVEAVSIGQPANPPAGGSGGAVAGAGGTGAGGAGGKPATAGAGGAGTGAPAAMGCTSMADQTIMKAAAFDGQATECAIACVVDPDAKACTTPCFEQKIGLSHACAVCNAANIACGQMNCFNKCLADPASPECRSCVMTNCDPAFRMCTGT